MKNKLVIDHIIHWLKQYSEQSKTNGFVIGISGGIDSAVTSTLCAKTGKPVICNEYNQENSSTTLMTGTVGGFKAGNYKYVIARSGSGTDDGSALNKGTSLTPLGIAYRDAIK